MSCCCTSLDCWCGQTSELLKECVRAGGEGVLAQESSLVVAVVYRRLWASGPAHISTPSPRLIFSPLLMSFGSREVKILMGSTPRLWPWCHHVSQVSKFSYPLKPYLSCPVFTILCGLVSYTFFIFQNILLNPSD